MMRARWILVAGGLGLVAAAAQQPGREPAARTAAEGVPHGVLRFELRDEGGRPMPGRLTFLGAGGPRAELFPGVDAQPGELAVRKNVIYSRSGRGAVTVPAGSYELYATRGIEWSLAQTRLELRDGETQVWTPQLVREIDTGGQVCGDFHLHTLTYSGHGDANLEERVISLIGEGVEFAVATDHNHHTDYGPTVAQLGVEPLLGHTVGNEVSTPLGHFNAFPLDPTRAPVDASLDDGHALFRLLRAEPNARGIRPVIQLNHPRWGDIDYFGKAGLGPVTGRSSSARFSDDFDTVEVLNENSCWGYYDAQESGEDVGRSAHSVLRDWFNLLNRGHRYAAVGNSDSHTVHDTFAGYPRNYVPSAARTPGEIDVGDVAAALRAGQVFTTTGPIVELSIDGVPMGGLVTAGRPGRGSADGPGADVQVHVRVQAASWIDCRRAKLVVNGVVRTTLEVPPSRAPLRLDREVPLHLERDAWVAVLVEGDAPMLPIAASEGRTMRPLAIANPIRVDADGDGVWTAPCDQAARALAQAKSADELEDFPPETSLELLLLAAAETRSALGPALIERSFDSREHRRTRLAAARCAEALADEALLPVLERLWQRTTGDCYAQLASLRALHACGDPAFGQRLADWMDRSRVELDTYAPELEELLPGRAPADWMVLGPFERAYEGMPGPEVGAGIERADPGGASRDWAPARTDERGYLDLRAALERAGGPVEDVATFAQTWLLAPAAGEYPYALGSDDGCRVWVGGALLLEDPDEQGARPFDHTGKVALEAGWNRVLMRVENGGGPHGLYFRVLDAGVAARALPE